MLRGQPAGEPKNLSDGWVGFDLEKAFGCPVKVVNDAAMQALGSYSGGRMLFLGLGTGLGSALITDGVLVPMELAHLRYRNSVLGGGNATKLKRLPERVRLGDNTHAFTGGFRLWEEAWTDERPACVVRRGLIETVPTHRLSPHDTYEDAVGVFDQHVVECVCVLDQENHLLGVVTRSELFGAFEQGRGLATKVEDFMLTNPIMVTPDQSPMTVAELMHKHDVDWLPVVENRDSRRVIGVIRSERMLRRLTAQMSD